MPATSGHRHGANKTVREGAWQNAMNNAIEDLKKSGKNPTAKESSDEDAGKSPVSDYISLFLGGTTIAVHVGEPSQVYTVPLEFLSSHSKFFQSGWDGGSSPSDEQTVYLKAMQPRHFEYVLQWIGTKDVIPENPPNQPAPNSTLNAILRLQEYINFLTVATELSITPDPAPRIVMKMKKIMAKFPDNFLLTRSMVKKAWLLASDHPVRRLFIEACVMWYVQDRFMTIGDLTVVPGFNADFTRYAVDFISKPCYRGDEKGFVDPVNGRWKRIG